MVKVFGHHVPVQGCIEFLADLMLCFIAVVLAAMSLRPGGQDVTHGDQAVIETLVLASSFALVMSFCYACVGLYRATPIRGAAKFARTLCALGVGGVVSFFVLRTLADQTYVEQVVLGAVVYVVVGLAIARSLISVMTRAAAPRRVLIVGTGAEAVSVAEDLQGKDVRRSALVGFYPAGSAEPVVGDVAPVFHASASLLEVARRHKVQDIVVAVREQRGGGLPMDELLVCRTHGVRVFDLAGYYERTRAEVPLESLKASWLVYGQGFVQGRARKTAKRAFDIVVSLLLLLLAAPVMLLAALAIKLDSRGPVLYRQERVGLNGRAFMCLKFRSMRNDAERDGVARWASKDDPRVTRVGSFIRKMRIDELPQLLSVLRGEMSLVGPRPERPTFVAELDKQIPFYGVRHCVKPGVTGWAQVRYTYGASVEDARRKHQLDLYYVKNNSLFLDMLVLVQTVSVVLFREGQ